MIKRYSAILLSIYLNLNLKGLRVLFMSGQRDVATTRYWHALEADRVQCDLCPHFCKIKVGQQGLCFVRANIDNQLKLTTYGRSSGFSVDPIEKKPLNHFHPGSSILSFGTAGCNLTCKFCQNWDMSKAREMDILADKASPEVIARAAKELGCSSVAYTYNDPVIFLEYAVDVAAACREVGVKSVAVTAGYICEEPRVEFFSAMDAANVDLKAFSDSFYKKLCGGHLQPVLETLQYIKDETDVWLELTTLLIPGQNDSDQELHQMTEWVVDKLGPDVPMHFTAFHPTWKMTDLPPTPAETLTRARQIAIKSGVRHAYTGNVHDKSGESTYCHQCGEMLIGRDWYELSDWHLTETGCCQFCGTPCVGVSMGKAGDWGGRRMPVILSQYR
jgi:pyruvate formate lyase activating enzyme